MLGPIDELDLDGQGLDQLQSDQQLGKGLRGLMPLLDGMQHRGHLLQPRALPAVREEQRLPFRLADLGMVQVDVHYGHSARYAIIHLLLETDQQGLTLNTEGDVCRIPSVLVQKEVFTLIETQQRDRLEVSAFLVLDEEQRIVHLHLSELHGEDPRHVHVVGAAGAIDLVDPQVLVRNVVEENVVGHFESRCAGQWGPLSGLSHR